VGQVPFQSDPHRTDDGKRWEVGRRQRERGGVPSAAWDSREEGGHRAVGVFEGDPWQRERLYARTTERTSTRAGSRVVGAPRRRGRGDCFATKGPRAVTQPGGGPTEGERAEQQCSATKGLRKEATRERIQSQVRYEADSGDDFTPRRPTEQRRRACRCGRDLERGRPSARSAPQLRRDFARRGWVFALESARGGDPRTEFGRLEGRMAGTRGSHEPPGATQRRSSWSRKGTGGATSLQATRGRIVGGPHVQPPPCDRRLIPPSQDAAPRGPGRGTS